MGTIVSYFFGQADNDIVDSETGLTGKQKKIVKETWKILRANSVETGVTIMFNYFKKYPKYHGVFPSFKDVPLEELPGNRKFQAHCQNIVATLTNAFDALDDPGLMEAILYTTGERHGRRGQIRQDFIDLKGVIMNVMKDKLGAKFSEEVERTWDKVIDIAFAIIFRGMESCTAS